MDGVNHGLHKGEKKPTLFVAPARERAGGIARNREEEDQEVTLPKERSRPPIFRQSSEGGNTK